MTAKRRAGWLALGAALVGAAVLWLPMRAPHPIESSERRDAGARTRVVVDARGSAREQNEQARAAPLARADLARLLAATSQAAPKDHAHERPADGRPHPISPDHVRLLRDVDLLRAADAAIRAGRYGEARALVAEHHRELMGMSVLEEEGLLLLADCAEQRSASNVARVQRFYDEHTDSTLRRRLRRACLEAAPSLSALQ